MATVLHISSRTTRAEISLSHHVEKTMPAVARQWWGLYLERMHVAMSTHPFLHCSVVVDCAVTSFRCCITIAMFAPLPLLLHVLCVTTSSTAPMTELPNCVTHRGHLQLCSCYRWCAEIFPTAAVTAPSINSCVHPLAVQPLAMQSTAKG